MKTPKKFIFNFKRFKLKLFFLSFISSASVAALDPAARIQVPACETVPQSNSFSSGNTVSFADLPKSILLAREAKIEISSIDGPNGNFKIRAHQDFIRPNSVVDCVSGETQQPISLTLSVPTLLDLTANKKVGNSVWQFNLSISDNNVGIWNQVSRIQSALFKIENFVLIPGQQAVLLQISVDEYELIITQKDLTYQKIIIVDFDAIENP